jgi:ADP-ribose pyrophosphatase YjhB (NUDIX family)
LIDEQDRILISDERTQNVSFTKFPGGGLEYGEGLIDALKREFVEECNAEIEIVRHIYTTDFFEKSSFNHSQILSVYYQVRALNKLELDFKQTLFDFDENSKVDKQEAFRLVPAPLLSEDNLTFKTDKVAWQVFRETLGIK